MLNRTSELHLQRVGITNIVDLTGLGRRDPWAGHSWPEQPRQEERREPLTRRAEIAQYPGQR